jgi:hypothetical protein
MDVFPGRNLDIKNPMSPQTTPGDENVMAPLKRGAFRTNMERPGMRKVFPAIGKMDAHNPRPAERSMTLRETGLVEMPGSAS